MRHLRVLACLLMLLLVAAGCGDDAAETADTDIAGDTAAPGDTATTDEPATEEQPADGETGEPADPADEPMTATGAATVAVADSDLGQILVDAEGMTLYLFDNDSDGTSACFDQCAQNWPPLVTDGDPMAGEGADAALLGTTDRGDGTMQVTYNGFPLYYFAADEAPGDTNGQAVGGVWWAVTPEGERVAETAAAAY